MDHTFPEDLAFLDQNLVEVAFFSDLDLAFLGLYFDSFQGAQVVACLVA